MTRSGTYWRRSDPLPICEIPRRGASRWIFVAGVAVGAAGVAMVVALLRGMGL